MTSLPSQSHSPHRCGPATLGAVLRGRVLPKFLPGALCVSAALFVCGAVRAEVPRVTGLRLSRVVARFTLQEIFFTLSGQEGNPYDRRAMSVNALVVAPSGREMLVPAFYAEPVDPYRRRSLGPGGWRIRFAPVEEGEYKVEIVVGRNDTEALRLASAAFRAGPSRSAGFVRVRGRQFVLDDGTTFFPVGANRCWGTPERAGEYLEDMKTLAGGGLNTLRVWICPWWIPLETNAGRFDQNAAALLDAIVTRAEELGLRLILCIEQHGNLQRDGREIGLWAMYPYNSENGGPCRAPADFFNDPEAKRLFKDRLRYIVARWGYSTAIMAWQLFNEVEWTDFGYTGFDGHRNAVTAWHAEMSDYLHRVDPFDHLVSTSSEIGFQEKLLGGGHLDFLSLHIYETDFLAERLCEIVADATRRVEAPVLIEECGPVEKPDHARAVTRAVLAAAVAGRGAGALPWLQDVNDLDPHVQAVERAGRFLADVRWAKERYEPIGPRVVVEMIEAANDPAAALRDPIRVTGLKGKQSLLLFAFAGSDSAPRNDVVHIRFRIPDVAAGEYIAEVWDIAAGKAAFHREIHATHEGLVLDLRQSPAEIAVKIERSALPTE